MSPTQRSIAELKRLGYAVATLERWNQWARRRQDVFGADLLGLPMESGPALAVQCSTGSHHSARRKKLHDEGYAALWKNGRVQVEVWSWRKQGARGKRKVWTLRREAL